MSNSAPTGGQDSGGDGTIVKLPPPPPQTTIATTGSNITAPTSNLAPPVSSSTAVVHANIAKRKAQMESRKRELLLEAREARVAWVLNGGGTSDENDGSGEEGSGKPRLDDLRACVADSLPCAPQIIESMLSLDYCDDGISASLVNGMLERILEKENMSWESISTLERNAEGKQSSEDESSSPDMAVNHASLNLPQIPSPRHYSIFLNALCEPSAANLVISIQKFCKTIKEAASVMAATMQESIGNGGADESTKGENGNAAPTQIDHEASLFKAIRGFVNTTLREMEEHESFRGYLYPKQTKDDELNDAVVTATTKNEKSPTDKVDDDARNELQASLEEFVYVKCRGDIDAVLLAGKESTIGTNDEGDNESTKKMEEVQHELHHKMLSLQFVTPAHLEIGCLKSTAAGRHDDIDLSYSVRQLRSVDRRSSPRRMLRSMLLAHRGVSVALDEARGDGVPPGADDVLPALILAVLRAHPPGLPTALRFVERFAAPPMLRGEAGYAHTNLCAALQFIKELDMDGHLAEVTLGGMGEGAVLSIGPEEFRAGLEECRGKMEMKLADEGEFLGKGQKDGVSREDLVEFDGGKNMDGAACTEDGAISLGIEISARQLRESRLQGESIDLDWAIKRQNESVWQEGRVKELVKMTQRPETEASTIAVAQGQQEWSRCLLPEQPPLPAQFSRSYSFLATRPDNINMSDLPRLLKEYKLLVHATETLLNERTVWRESEQKRQLKLERQNLEREFVDVIGEEESNLAKLANGH